jgi:VanZ family protein
MRLFSEALNRAVFYRLPVIALCVLIFWQSSCPGIISAPLFPHDDKVLHFLCYALLAFLCARDLGTEKPQWSRAKIRCIAITFACLFGLSDEIHQAFVPSRTASVYDLIADCLGGVFGSLVVPNPFLPKA